VVETTFDPLFPLAELGAVEGGVAESVTELAVDVD
jgi:hypothetical protein